MLTHVGEHRLQGRIRVRERHRGLRVAPLPAKESRDIEREDLAHELGVRIRRIIQIPALEFVDRGSLDRGVIPDLPLKGVAARERPGFQHLAAETVDRVDRAAVKFLKRPAHTVERLFKRDPVMRPLIAELPEFLPFGFREFRLTPGRKPEHRPPQNLPHTA